MKIMDKKGVLGLDTARQVMLFFLILAVLAVTIFLALTSLRDTVEGIDTTTVAVTNESISSRTDGASSDFAYAPSDDYRLATCSGLVVSNTTSGVAVSTGNYSVTTGRNCAITGTAGTQYANATVYATYSVTYANPETNLIVKNISGAMTNDFFDQTGTIFAILIVVVIIFAISIIIYAVSRFNAGGGGGGSVGGGSNYGRDTVMGI